MSASFQSDGADQGSDKGNDNRNVKGNDIGNAKRIDHRNDVDSALTLTAAFVDRLWHTPFTAESLRRAKFGIVDYVASSYAGKDDPGVNKLKQVIAADGGLPYAPLLYQRLAGTAAQAALLNGFMGHALDYDDVHTEVRGHPGTVILPALFALGGPDGPVRSGESRQGTDRGRVDVEPTARGEEPARGASGRRLLEAYVLGVEAMARLALALTGAHYERGFHNTATAGVLAATLAGAYLRGYTPQLACRALGLAASQAGGLRVHFGSEAKPLHAGLAASAAVRSLQFAAAGIAASGDALAGPAGFFTAYGEGDAAAVRERLLAPMAASDWRIEQPGLWFKLHPFCSAAYYGVHALEQLAPLTLRPDEIASVDLAFTPGSDAALIHRSPATGEEGRFSLEYIAALMLSGRGLHPAHFQPIALDAELQAYLARMSRSYPSDQLPPQRCTRITLRLTDGRTLSAVGDRPKGSPANPVTEAELLVKFRSIVGSSPAAQALLQTILDLEAQTDIASTLLAGLRDFGG